MTKKKAPARRVWMPKIWYVLPQGTLMQWPEYTSRKAARAASRQTLNGLREGDIVAVVQLDSTTSVVNVAQEPTP